MSRRANVPQSTGYRCTARGTPTGTPRRLPPGRPKGLYRQTDRAVWQVGFFDSTGDWCSESAHPRSAAAADRVHWLNGGASAPDADRQLDQADDEITRLQAQITTLTRDRDKWRNQALRRVRGRRTR